MRSSIRRRWRGTEVSGPTRTETWQGQKQVVGVSSDAENTSAACGRQLVMSRRPHLRPYQQKAVQQITDALNASARVLYQLATGAGKTVVFCDLTHSLAAAGGRVLVLVHRDEILQQASRKLRDLRVRHGMIAPGNPQTDDAV